MDIIRAIEQQQINPEVASFNVGDTVKVHYRIKEGDRERIQVFQGDVIRRHGASNRETFTVRKISFSVGVERTFPVHSPKIEKIEVTRRQGRQGCEDQGKGILRAPSFAFEKGYGFRTPFFRYRVRGVEDDKLSESSSSERALLG